MISFKQVTIKNFRAYEDQSIVFTSDNGVFLMSGDNGSGKSTFLNAINWCLYGDTPFYTIEDSKEVLNSHAPDDAIASVELFADIRGSRYRFYRTTRRGSYGGVLNVSVEDNGNWKGLDGTYGQDAVRRILPKDIRHLFFFNGEQLKDIFSKDSTDHNLKASVYKVSELNVIDNAMKHLSTVEKLYENQMKKQARYKDKIEELSEKKEDLENRIEGHTEVIAELQNKVKKKKQQRDELDKLIKDTAESRLLLEKRDELSERIKGLKAEIDDLSFQKSEVFHENYHRLILHADFEKYRDALVEASRQGVLPPPINPTETAKILQSGVCSVCEHHITDAERVKIQSKHTEYARLEELQYLVDGVNAFDNVSHELPKVKHNYTDILQNIHNKRSEKSKLEEELKKVNESLEGIDEAKMHDNPQLRRTHIEDRIIQITQQIGFDARNKDLLMQSLKKVEGELHRAAQQSPEIQRYDDLRLRAQRLRGKLSLVKGIMEDSIRAKLQKSIWEVFSAILPHTNFTNIKIDSDYTLTLTATDGITYNTNMLATGPTKVLGLSLAHALSKDLGYTDVPFLIDNLYGDIKESHFDEITKMVSSLANDKQVIIMDLNIDKTEHGFDGGVIAQKFIIERLVDTNKTIIREVAYES